jgi:hypothetical protein
MSVEVDLRREIELAMRDEEGLLAATHALLECVWRFISEPVEAPAPS